MSKPHILIIDDEPDIRDLISDILADEGYSVSTAENGDSARVQLGQQKPDLVLLDIWMPDIDGISLLKSWRDAGTLQFPVVMMSGHGTIETAIEATKIGAKDFVEKPISLAKLLQTIEQTLSQHNSDAHSGLATNWHVFEPIGNSDSTRQLRQQLDRIIQTTSNVLLIGDSGTGKLNVAKYLHQSRNEQTQAAVISDALSWPEESLQNTLQALWQTIQGQPGLKSIIIANVDCLTAAQQTTLAATIKGWQSHQLALIATAEQDLKWLLSQGDFQRELYDLLCEVSLTLPSLSERAEDVPELINFYVNFLPDHEQTPYRKMSFAGQNLLRNYAWPGNIRELKNLVRQLQLLGNEGDISVNEVESLLSEADQPKQAHATPEWYDLDLREAREAFERDYLLHHLAQVEGKVGELAKVVGLERTHLYRKLRALGINTKTLSKTADKS